MNYVGITYSCHGCWSQYATSAELCLASLLRKEEIVLRWMILGPIENIGIICDTISRSEFTRFLEHFDKLIILVLLTYCVFGGVIDFTSRRLSLRE